MGDGEEEKEVKEEEKEEGRRRGRKRINIILMACSKN